MKYRPKEWKLNSFSLANDSMRVFLIDHPVDRLTSIREPTEKSVPVTSLCARPFSFGFLEPQETDWICSGRDAKNKSDMTSASIRRQHHAGKHGIARFPDRMIRRMKYDNQVHRRPSNASIHQISAAKVRYTKWSQSTPGKFNCVFEVRRPS